MPFSTHQLGNIGSLFVFSIVDQDGAVVDLSSATTLTVIFRASPTSASFQRDGVLTTDGTDGKFQYATIAGDLSTAGDQWRRQGYVVIPEVGSFYTTTQEFSVKANL